METETKLIDETEEFQTALKRFISGAQEIIDKQYAGSIIIPKLDFDYAQIRNPKRKFLRIFKVDKYTDNGREIVNSQSAYCFIDLRTGDVLKSESWKKPHPKPRSNILNERNGLDGVTAYGANYLKRG